MTWWDKELAEQVGRDFDGAPAEGVLEWALDRFARRILGGRVHPVAYGGDRLFPRQNWADSVTVPAAMLGVAVLAGLGPALMASRLRPGVPVVFLDTGYHFAETVGTAAAMETRYPITLLRVTPRLSVPEQDARYGPRLHERDPDRCCAMRKVTPLIEALAPYDAWVSGIRRGETAARSGAGVVEYDERRGKVKINPIASWSDADVESYIAEHNVLLNPLLAEGYDSVGCAPCTLPALAGARSGRWAGTGKTECGLHG